jgi:hypothetical protein
VQLILEGTPYQKTKHTVGSEVIGLDLGPSTLAIVPRQGQARLLPLCEELRPDVRKKRRLPQSLVESQQEFVSPHERREALARKQEPPVLEPGESQSAYRPQVIYNW